jgi:hypothetical protein
MGKKQRDPIKAERKKNRVILSHEQKGVNMFMDKMKADGMDDEFLEDMKNKGIGKDVMSYLVNKLKSDVPTEEVPVKIEEVDEVPEC